MKLMEYEDHPLLPSNAPQGQLHIIKDGQKTSSVFDCALPNHSRPADLCDSIATILYRLEDHPTAPHDFFDPAIKSFKFLRIQKKDSSLMSSMIWCIGNEVMVSLNR